MDTEFALLQDLVKRMEKLLEDIKQDIKDINANFTLHERQSSELRQDTNRLMEDMVSVKTTLYDESHGMMSRVRANEQEVMRLKEWRQSTTSWIEKVFWEAAKPIIGLLVTGLLIGLAILIVFIYSLQFLVQLLP
jgi:chromosome segregation ATPase